MKTKHLHTQLLRHMDLGPWEVDQAYARQCFDYDPESGVLTWRHRPRSHFATRRQHGVWNARYAGTEAGSASSDGAGRLYRKITLQYKPLKNHRLIWLWVHGEWPPEEIDHIDGDGLNNQLSNLRAVSKTENLKNCQRRISNRSGVTGVSFNKRVGKWHARAQTGGVEHHLGYSDDFFEAVCMRKSAENTYGFHVNHGRKAA